MTKKNYIAFAQYIKGLPSKLIQRECAEMIVKIASQDNPAFDKSRFLKACGL